MDHLDENEDDDIDYLGTVLGERGLVGDCLDYLEEIYWIIWRRMKMMTLIIWGQYWGREDLWVMGTSGGSRKGSTATVTVSHTHIIVIAQKTPTLQALLWH